MPFLARLVFDFNRDMVDILMQEFMTHLAFDLLRIRSFFRDHMSRHGIFRRR